MTPEVGVEGRQREVVRRLHNLPGEEEYFFRLQVGRQSALCKVP